MAGSRCRHRTTRPTKLKRFRIWPITEKDLLSPVLGGGRQLLLGKEGKGTAGVAGGGDPVGGGDATGGGDAAPASFCTSSIAAQAHALSGQKCELKTKDFTKWQCLFTLPPVVP